MRPFRFVRLSLGLSAALAAALAAAPARAADRAASDHPPFPAGATARIVPERSGPGRTTWDLGADPGRPGMRRYALALDGGAPRPEVRLPARLGKEPAVWTLDDGRRVEWRFENLDQPLTQFPEPAVPATPENPGAPLAAPAGGSAARREGAADHFQIRLPASGELATTLWLDPGLRLETSEKPEGTEAGRVRVRDENGAVLDLRFSAATVALAELEGGRYSLLIRPAPSARSAVAPRTIDAWTNSPIGSWGGWQCLLSGSPYTAGNGNPYSWLYTGMYSTNYPCDSYLLWDLSALPATATATGVWLYPIYANAHAGAPQTITVYDVDKSRALNTAAGYAPDLATFNDFNTMYGGRPVYGTFAVGAAGNFFPELNGQAVADLNDRKRINSYFAVGLGGSATAAGNYSLFTTNSSRLWIYYVDYAPNQIVLNHLHAEYSTNSEVDLYNYGEALDISGWQIKSQQDSASISTYAFPAGTVIPRHGRIRVIAATGTNTATTFYTGNGFSFFWWNPTSRVQVWLLRADLTGADYVCWVAGATPAPPAGTGWTGPCIAGQPSFGPGNVARVADGDSDAAGDWAFNVAPATLPPPPSNAGQLGARRRSEVFINHFLVYGGYNMISLANYGPPIDLANWKLEIWSGQATYGTRNGIFTFPAGVVGSGQVVWLVEGTTYFPTPDALHRNLGFAVGWNGSPNGGYAVLRDAGGRGRDFIVFGNPRDFGGGSAPEALPSELTWTGSPIPLSGPTPDLIRDSDLNTQSAAGWLQQASITNWGLRGPNALGPSRRQEEIGTNLATPAAPVGHYNYGSGGPFGAGPVVTVSKQVGIEEFALEGSVVSGPAAATLVVKQQGNPSLFFTRAVTVNEVSGAMISTGRINPPLALTPGSYAFMLYVNGDWKDTEIAGSAEALSFGTLAGYATEVGYSPSASFATLANWSVHSFFSTLEPPVVTNVAALPAGERTVAYPAFSHAATGGYGAYAWSVTAGALPAGLTLSAAGVLSGTPSVEGWFTFTVRVSDAAGLWSEQAETLFIYPPLEVGTSAVSDYNTATEPYSYPLSAYGGVPPYAWGCTGLPAGLSCNSGGVLSGTLGGAVGDGVYAFTAQVTDALGVIASRALSLTVRRTPQILTPSPLPDGALGRLYGSLQLQAVGGQGAVTWSLGAGLLPDGLSLAPATGIISGTPTKKNVFSFTILYSTALGGAASRAYTLTVGDDSGPGHWIRKGLAGGSVNPRYSPNFATDRTILGANKGTLYVSRDGGYYWKPLGFSVRRMSVNGQTYDNNVNTLAVSPDFDAGAPLSGSNKTIFVATESGGVYYSDNFGVSFYRRNIGLASADDPALAYAADLFVAPDYPTSHRVYCRSFVPAGGYYALFSGVVNVATRTITWNRVSPAWLRIGDTANNASTSLFWSPTFATDQTLFAKICVGVGSCTWQLFRSTDAGVTWTKVHDFAAGKFALTVAISPRFSTDGTIFYADNYPAGVVRRSSDGGKSFVSLAPQWPVLWISIPPDYDAGTNPVVFATAYNVNAGTLDLIRSGDNGATWTLRGTLGSPVLLPQFSPNFGSGPTQDQLMIGGFFGGQLNRSEDGGVSGSPSDGGLFIQEIASFAFAPNFPTSRRAFLAIGDKIFHSENGGRAWKKAATPGGRSIQSLRVSPAFASDGKVFAFACVQYNDCMVWRSTDGGLTFAAIGPAVYQLQDVEDFQLSPNFGSDQMIFFTTYPLNWVDSMFKRSSDGGLTYSAQGVMYADEVDNFGISPGFATDQTLYANHWTGIGPDFKTTSLSVNGAAPAGLSWGNLASGPVSGPGSIPPAFPPEYNRATGVDGTVSHTFFWNCRKTTNAGVTWSPVPVSGPGCGAWGGKLFVSPTYAGDATLYSVVQTANASNPAPGLFRSNDGGVSFTAMSAAGNPAAFDYVNQVAISPNYATDGLVFVATAAGLYKTLDWGASWQLTTGSDPISPDVSVVAVDPNASGGLFLGTVGGEVFSSGDGGVTAQSIGGTGGSVFGLEAVGNPTLLVMATRSGLFRRTDLTPQGTWIPGPAGAFTSLRKGTLGATPALIAANLTGSSYYSTDNGASWIALGTGANGAADIVSASGAGFAAPGGKSPAGSAADLWAATPSGASYSLTSGSTWTLAPGGNDYQLPTLGGTGAWTTIRPADLGASGRRVLLGNNGGDGVTPASNGVWLSKDGGDTWRNVSQAGSGLEATSKNVSAFLTATTPQGGTDLLVGVNGTSNGGVYLSGDGGEHWTQVNQGYDPNSLSISSLVKTSCAGCPVQYYSGTFGGGVFTRTITVKAPPAFPVANYACWGSTGCACASGTGSGPEEGGQPFRLCGSGFQNGIAVEFDGVAASGCAQSGGTVVTCTGTPPHAPGAAVVRVRNLDTRAGTLPAGYTYTSGTSRASGLAVAKSGANAWVSWNCAGCTAGSPARLYRAQNAIFSLYLETYNGGASGTTTGGCTAAAGTTSCHNQTGAAGSAQSYFWSVE